MWGIFETEESIHVIPCDKSGYLKPPHSIDDLCSCEPELEHDQSMDRYLMIHNEAN